MGMHALNKAFKLPQTAACSMMLEAMLLLFHYKPPVTWCVSKHVLQHCMHV